MRGKDLRCGAIAIAASNGEAISDVVELFKPTQWSERGEGRRSGAPASDNATDRGIVDCLDAPVDLNWVEWGAVDQ